MRCQVYVCASTNNCVSLPLSCSHCIHQILESVNHIHQHDIVHRDLKVIFAPCHRGWGEQPRDHWMRQDRNTLLPAGRGFFALTGLGGSWSTSLLLQSFLEDVLNSWGTFQSSWILPGLSLSEEAPWWSSCEPRSAVNFQRNLGRIHCIEGHFLVCHWRDL